MTATKDEKIFTAEISCTSPNDIKITFISPETVEGFEIKTADEGYEVNISGISEISDKNSINDASVLNILFSTIKTSVFTNHGSFTKTDNGYTAVLSIDMIPVKVSFSEEGYITEMLCEALNFSAVFDFSG